MLRNILLATNPHHHLKVRIPLEDVDLTGCMYHGHYLKYFDRCRTDFLLQLGFSHHQMIQERSFFVVKKVEQDFLKPLYLESIVTANTWVEKVGGSSLIFMHTFAEDEQTLFKSRVVLVHVGDTFKPKPLPKFMRECLMKFVGD
jgi:tol-pal system-associated acyl-CoA thioesterase